MKKILVQLVLLLFCFVVAQSIMYFIVDDILVRVVGTHIIFILARVLLGLGLWILINLIIILKNQRKYQIPSGLLFLMYFVYFIFLISILFLKQEFDSHNYNLIPFLSLYHHDKVSFDILLIELSAMM